MDNYQITFQTWNKIASIYQDKFMNLDLYNDTYDAFCKLVHKPNSKILEIGCGPGNITKYLLGKRPDFEIEAIDIAPNMIELAKANNPTAHFTMMDCRNVHLLTSNFDAIICGFCMPYLSKEDCTKIIKDSSSLLKSDGIIYFSVIEGDYAKSGLEAGSSGDKSFVYYHQEDYLKKQLNLHNFSLIDLIRKHYPETNSTHLIFIGKKYT